MLFCPLRITTNQVSASVRNHSNLYQRFVPIFVLVEWVQFHRDIRFESILRSCWSGRDIFWHITTMASKEWISVAQFHTRGFRPSMGQEFVPVEREENRGSMFFFWEYCSWTSIRKQVWPHPTCQWQGQTCAELSMMRLAILDSCCSWATIITIITRAINTSILQRVYSSHCSPKNVHEISGCFKQAKEIF